MNLRVLVIGGIFDKPKEYRAAHRVTPETTLADGLVEEGFQVTVQGPSKPPCPDQFDLVHVHHFGRAAARMLARPSACRFVFTSHDPFLVEGIDQGWRHELLVSMVLRGADGVVALSDRERSLLTSKYCVPDSQVAVIPNGIPELFEAPEGAGRGAGHNDSDKDLLFVGQLQPFKGLDYLFSAMPAIRAQHPGVRLRLCHQSDGLLHQYRQRVEQLGIADCVVFEGPRSPEQLAALYRSCAVVVHPSLAECLCSVISEAMLSGACIVATDVGGIREQLDARSGVIVRPRDSRSLAVALCGVLGSPERRERMGAAARIRARQRFTVPSMIRRHVRFYERVLSARPVRRPFPVSLLAGGVNACLKVL